MIGQENKIEIFYVNKDGNGVGFSFESPDPILDFQDFSETFIDLFHKYQEGKYEMLSQEIDNITRPENTSEHTK